MITGADIVEDARKYIGTPYKLGGRTPSGLDCVGLVTLVARDFGLNWEIETPIPKTQAGIDWEQISTTLKRIGFRRIDIADAHLGDLMVWGFPLGGAGTVKMNSAAWAVSLRFLGLRG